MLRTMMLTIIASIIAACGAAGPCASNYTGSWDEYGGNGELELEESCSFSFSRSDDSCKSLGTYGAPLDNSGSMLVTITSTAGDDCLPTGTHSCSYSAGENAIAINCGFGIQGYTR